MLEEKLARLKKLVEQRDKIDAELAGMLGVSDQPRRGRPRKEQARSASSETLWTGESISVGPGSPQSTGETVSTSHGITVSSGNSQSTVRGSDAE